MAQMVKKLSAKQGYVFDPWLGDSLEKGMATHPVFLPGEFHVLVGYIQCMGHKESDMTEQLTL